MKIRDGYRAFHSSELPEHADLFKKLKSGQRPEVLLVTCSDSRIDPAMITKTLPGEVFVIRNAGNLIPTRQASGGAASLEFGVKVLEVKHVVVCGHSHCGAVSAALAPESLGELPYVAAWLKESGPDLTDFDRTVDDPVSAAVEFNVLRQLDNLRSMPFVRDAIDAGKLELHGWVYRFETGEIREFDCEKNAFVSLI